VDLVDGRAVGRDLRRGEHAGVRVIGVAVAVLQRLAGGRAVFGSQGLTGLQVHERGAQGGDHDSSGLEVAVHPG
jgi:hypothetical protein